MQDRDLAELYGIETKRLKEQVRRNIERFPEDFMFELTKEELKNWRSQFATSNQDITGLRIPPFAFTEYGVLMLSSVLKSERAVQVNIYPKFFTISACCSRKASRHEAVVSYCEWVATQRMQ